MMTRKWADPNEVRVQNPTKEKCFECGKLVALTKSRTQSFHKLNMYNKCVMIIGGLDAILAASHSLEPGFIFTVQYPPNNQMELDQLQSVSFT
jgi:hypothetical protein